MRYIIETKNEQGTIGAQITKWQKEKKIEIIEKGQPIIEIRAQLIQVSKALDLLRSVGYNESVMLSYIHDNTKVSKKDIMNMLSSQQEFFRAIGILHKK